MAGLLLLWEWCLLQNQRKFNWPYMISLDYQVMSSVRHARERDSKPQISDGHSFARQSPFYNCRYMLTYLSWRSSLDAIRRLDFSCFLRLWKGNLAVDETLANSEADRTDVCLNLTRPCIIRKWGICKAVQDFRPKSPNSNRSPQLPETPLLPCTF